MPRTAAASIQDIISEAVDSVVERVSRSMARALAEAQAQAARQAGPDHRWRSRLSRRPPRLEISKWVADRRARRVPTFVIDATGLDTKKRIVAKFGENAVFRKGKPLPRVK